MKNSMDYACCDICNRQLGNTFQDIKKEGHYISSRKAKNGLPWDIICKDCISKETHKPMDYYLFKIYPDDKQ